MRYFTGEFDGSFFRCDHALDQLNKVDAGKDFYAAIPFSQTPDHKLILVGWMNNWAYANENPTEGWKGMMSLPREIALIKENDGSYRLLQAPLETLQAWRTNKREYFFNHQSKVDPDWNFDDTEAMELQIILDSRKGAVIEFDFGRKAKLMLTWDAARRQLCCDRTNKVLAFHPASSTIECANIVTAHTLTLHLLIDRYSLDLFTGDGRVALTSLFFAPGLLQKLRITGKQYSAKCTLWDLKMKTS